MVLGQSVTVAVIASSAPSASVTIRVTATPQGEGMAVSQDITLTSDNYSEVVVFNNLIASTYVLSVVPIQLEIVNIGGATATITIIDPSKPMDMTMPAILLTPTVTDYNLVVEVAVNNNPDLPALSSDTVIGVSLNGTRTTTMARISTAGDNEVTLTDSVASAMLSFEGLEPDIYMVSATAAGVNPIESKEVVIAAPQLMVTLPLASPDIMTDTMTDTMAAIGLSLDKAPLRDVMVSIGTSPVTVTRLVTFDMDGSNKDQTLQYGIGKRWGYNGC